MGFNKRISNCEASNLFASLYVFSGDKLSGVLLGTLTKLSKTVPVN